MKTTYRIIDRSGDKINFPPHAPIPVQMKTVELRPALGILDEDELVITLEYQHAQPPAVNHSHDLD